MSILIYNNTNRDLKPWVEALKTVEPDIDIQIYPDIKNKDDIVFVLTWPYPIGLWQDFLNLKAICSIGAGVNHIIKDTTLHNDIDIIKLVDDNLNQSMWEYVLSVTLFFNKKLSIYQAQQKDKIWYEQKINSFSNTTIGIMGLGQIGTFLATNFIKLGFKVKGYSYSKKDIQNIQTFCIDDSMQLFLDDIDILIGILPLTDNTQNIFDKKFFSMMKKDSYFINVGRGAQVVQDDLIYSLDKNHLQNAFLDVFANEPLEKENKLWSHPKVYITPHIASITDPKSVAFQIVQNYQRVKNGLKPFNKIDKSRGY
jgi:glyoxylate/hydroxypyruvate reductase A